MKLLLQEYLSSGDISEACRCVQELDVPHFHHELVYEVCKCCVVWCGVMGCVSVMQFEVICY